ncbi:MAG: hypothetical protein WCQ59_07475 [Candidatus Cloacimonadaceae bacterium]|nr:hypothetical protein [Candidatus Cloacimonadota bacterium]
MSRKQQGMFTVCIMAFLIMVSGLYGSFFSHNSEVMPMGQIGDVFRAIDGTGLEDVRIDVYLKQAQGRSLHTGLRGEYSIKCISRRFMGVQFTTTPRTLSSFTRTSSMHIPENMAQPL